MREGTFFITTNNDGVHQPRTSPAAPQLNELSCPFFNNLALSCCAAGGEQQVGVFRQQLCNSDDHDSCPRFLAYLLRRTRPNRTDHDWLDAI